MELTQKEQELYNEVISIVKTAKYDTKTLYKMLKVFGVYFGVCFGMENNINEYLKYDTEIKKEYNDFNNMINKDLEIDISKHINNIDDDLKKCYEMLDAIKQIKNNINGV